MRLVSFPELLSVVVVPLAVATATILVARAGGLRPRAAWAASVALGFWLGQVGLAAAAGAVPADATGWIAQLGGWLAAWPAAVAACWRPHVARDWLPVVLLAALVVGLIDAYAGRRARWLTPGLALAVSLALPARLLWQSVYLESRWTTVESLAWLASLGLVGWLAWLLLCAARDDDQPLLRAALAIIATGGMALVLMMSGVRIYGVLTGAATMALAGSLAASLLPARACLAGVAGAAGPLVVAAGGLVMMGYFYAELTTPNALLLLLSLVAAAGWLPESARLQGALRATARSLLCLVPLAIAVVMAALAFAATMAEQAQNPYLQ